MKQVHTHITSGEFIELSEVDFAEYILDDGSKIHILIPDQIEIEDDVSLDPDDDIEDQYADNPNHEHVPGFTCYSCSGQFVLLDSHRGALLTIHIEECLGLEPIESEEGNVTMIRYQ